MDRWTVSFDGIGHGVIHALWDQVNGMAFPVERAMGDHGIYYGDIVFFVGLPVDEICTLTSSGTTMESTMACSMAHHGTPRVTQMPWTVPCMGRVFSVSCTMEHTMVDHGWVHGVPHGLSN